MEERVSNRDGTCEHECSYLNMETFVFERHHDHPRDIPIDSPLPRAKIVIQSSETGSNFISEGQYVVQYRPIFISVRNF